MNCLILTLKAETFASKNLQVFRVFWLFSRNLITFGNSKSAKRQSFFMQNHGSFSFRHKKIIKRKILTEFSIQWCLWFISTLIIIINYSNRCFLILGCCEHLSDILIPWNSSGCRPCLSFDWGLRCDKYRRQRHNDFK